MGTDGQGALLAAGALMVAAMAIIGVIDNYIVVLAETIGLWQFHAARATLALPLVAGLSLLGLGHMRVARPWAVVLRSALVAMAMICYFGALGFLPIAQALAGLFTSPIFILLITAMVLRHPIGRWRIAAVIVGFAGILLVLQPDPQAFDFRILVPVVGGFFYALGAITTRSLCAGESTVVLLGGTMVALGLLGLGGLGWLALYPVETASGAAGFVTRGWVWPMSGALSLVALQAAGSVIAVYMMTKAYQLGEPSYVSVFEYSVMVFGPLFAWVALGQPLGVLQMLGIGCIASAGIVIALRSEQVR